LAISWFITRVERAIVSCIMLCVLIVVVGCADREERQEQPESEQAPTTDQAEPQTFVFECGEGYSFVARIEGERIWLFLPDKTIPLPHVPAASGTKYSDGVTVFWSKGEEARLEMEGEEPRICTNNRAKAIWEHAKLNGVDFRAVGNEPGWHLEISSGLENIVFVTDYGKSGYEFPFAKPLVDDEAGRTVYRTSSGERELTIVLEGDGCYDTMSGEEFETTVTVVLDGTEYRGCGRTLH
jgi:membrane-bound inhibitor of C-type lysozyme/uncharacterized membrane protein